MNRRRLLPIVLVLAATFVLLNLLVDLSYRLLDPRIRLQE